MTVKGVIQAANRGNIASLDLELAAVLREQVMSDFYDDLQAVGGIPSWSKKNDTLTLLVNVKTQPLPDDFFHMEELYLPSLAAPNTGLTTKYSAPTKYIGEDPRLVAIAEQTTTPGFPQGYYIVSAESAAGSGFEFKTIKWDRPPDQAYVAQFSYIARPPIRDGTDDAELSKWIPDPLHWSLVLGLRKQIYLDRYGEEDPRYVAVSNDYDKAIKRGAMHKDLARRNFYVNLS